MPLYKAWIWRQRVTNISTVDKKEYQILSASTLKLIAVITMLIDHVAAGILLFTIREGIYPFGLDFDQASSLYYAMRNIGRVSFPLYCFLLVEGLEHTKSLPKYMINLLAFGIISEVPFDFALKVKKVPFSTDLVYMYQQNRDRLIHNSNVYVTLFIGLVVIACMSFVEKKFFTPSEMLPTGFMTGNPFHMILYLAPIAAGAFICYRLGSDYDKWGIVLISMLYIFRKNRLFACMVGYVFFINMNNEAYSLPAFLLMFLYNGEKGYFKPKSKYFFYLIYPVHLVILLALRIFVFAP